MKLRNLTLMMTNTNNEMNPAGAMAQNLETNMAATNSRGSRSGHADMRQNMVNLLA